MKVLVTPAIAELCREAGAEGGADEALAAAARAALAEGALEWPALKRLAAAAPAAPPLRALCAGGGVAPPPAPPPPPQQSAAFRARLASLRAALDQRRYDAMVADVTGAERAAAAAAAGGFSAYRAQLAFGAHVLAVMGAAYAAGHAAGGAVTADRALRPAFGLVAMFTAMVLETLLFAVRAGAPARLHEAAAEARAAARRRRVDAEAAAAAPAAALEKDKAA